MFTRCMVCPGEKKCIGPEGNPYSVVWLIGEGPGWEEERDNGPFRGKTGKELRNHYMRLAGLRPDEVLITNAIACMPRTPGGKISLTNKADVELVEACSGHNILPMIEEHQPKLLVLMGAFACYAVDPSIDLELQHGMPVQTRHGLAFPMYHPAGGIHEPKKMLLIRNDWIRLRKFMRGCLRIEVDEYAGKEDYREIQTKRDLCTTLNGLHYMPLSVDTETKYGGAPFCLTYSVKPGTGYLIRADRPDMLAYFQEYLDDWRSYIVFHYALHDYKECSKMGLSVPWRKVRDTMLRSFHLGNMPQGLKALAYRELGMIMEDFDDVVTPYSREVVIEYLRDVFTESSWPSPDEQIKVDKDGKPKLYKPQNFRTKLKRFWTDLTKNEDKDPFQAWDAWEESHEMVQERCGRWPGKCISHVPFDKVVRYACRDADATGRLWTLEQYMTKRVRRVSQDSWREL